MIANNYNSVLNALIKQKITLFDLEGLKHIDPKTALEARITFLKIRKKRKPRKVNVVDSMAHCEAPEGYSSTREAAPKVRMSQSNLGYYICKNPEFRNQYVKKVKKYVFISPEGINFLKKIYDKK